MASISDEEAKDYAALFIGGWAAEARNDLLGISESFDLDDKDALKVISWVDRARVTITFKEEV